MKLLAPKVAGDELALLGDAVFVAFGEPSGIESFASSASLSPTAGSLLAWAPIVWTVLARGTDRADDKRRMCGCPPDFVAQPVTVSRPCRLRVDARPHDFASMQVF